MIGLGGRTNKDSIAYYKDAVILYMNSDYHSALEKIDHAIELDYSVPEYHMKRADILVELGSNNEAIQSADRGFSLGKGNQYVTRAYGGVLYRLDRYEEAVRRFDDAIRMDPDDGNSYYLKGLALTEMQLEDEALKSFRKSSELDPVDPWPYFQIAEIFWQRDQNKQALRELDLGLRYDRKNEDYRLMRIDILEEMGREKELMEEINKSIKILPDSVELVQRKADILFDRGKYQESINVLSSYLQQGYLNVDIIQDISDKLRSLKLYSSALRFIDNILKQFYQEEPIAEKPEKLMVEELEILGEMGRYEEALQLVDEWVASDKDNYPLRRQRIFTLLDLERYDEAEDYARETYSRNPDSAEALSMLMMCIENKKKDEEILKMADQFIEKTVTTQPF